MVPPFKTIDEYINGFPDEVKTKLLNIREVIRLEAPSAVETINYGMPTFKLKGNLVHFAAYKNHIGFYPAPSGIENFKKELIPYKTSKGAIQFPLNQPVPYELITKMVRFRVAENLNKTNSTK